LSGKMVEGSTRQDIYYDRTEYNISAYVYQSIYKVFDTNKDLMYTLTVTHDQIKSLFFFAVKSKNSDVRGEMVEYDENECGLIFSDRGNTYTVFDMSVTYLYLISFTDFTRDYPILHKIEVGNGVQVELDRVTKLCLKKHNEIVRSHRVVTYISQKNRQIQEE